MIRTSSLSVAPFAALLLIGTAGCGNKEESAKATDPSKPKIDLGTVTKLESIDEKPGEGHAAVNGDRLYIAYRGTLKDGTMFDSNMDEKREMDTSKPPLTFILGTGAMIKGWDEGLVGAKKGAIKKLRVPWQLGYGEAGREPKIGPKQDLFFDIVVLDVVSKDSKNDTVDVKDTKIGIGPAITEASTVTMKYTGYHVNGNVFEDQTAKASSAPVKRLVKGFREGVIGMKKGGKATITVPAGMITANAKIQFDQIVKFDVEIIDVK